MGVIAFLRCLILTLFAVTGDTFGSDCLSLMLDFEVICDVREHLAILLLAVGSWRYFWKSFMGVAVSSLFLEPSGS